MNQFEPFSGVVFSAPKLLHSMAAAALARLNHRWTSAEEQRDKATEGQRDLRCASTFVIHSANSGRALWGAQKDQILSYFCLYVAATHALPTTYASTIRGARRPGPTILSYDFCQVDFSF